ncbi:MAG: hypothetical protein DCC67_11430 [Planctomycetota bacterium]|nr:MAG: hypothetical protein DCC67_11430 [Planctomycetota bacterium]
MAVPHCRGPVPSRSTGGPTRWRRRRTPARCAGGPSAPGPAARPRTGRSLHATIGNSFRRLGLLDRSEPHLRTALHLRRGLFGPEDVRVADSLVDLAWHFFDKGNRRDCLPPAREAIAIYRQAGGSQEDVLEAYYVLQLALASIARLETGRFDEPIAVAQEGLAIAGDLDEVQVPIVASMLHTLAAVQYDQGQYAISEATARRAVALHRRLHGRRHPETAWGLDALASALRAQRRRQEASAASRESLDIFPDRFPAEHGSVARARHRLASDLIALGNQAEELHPPDPGIPGSGLRG